MANQSTRSDLKTCEAHAYARRTWWADNYGSDCDDSPPVTKRLRVFSDGSELHRGTLVKYCRCPGDRYPANGEIAGGFIRYGAQQGCELYAVCDDCGPFCDCCAVCQVWDGDLCECEQWNT